MILLSQYKVAQESQASSESLTGNLYYDILNDSQQDVLYDSVDMQKSALQQKMYSPMKAALYSAIIPGAGQFYTKSYWQSAAFFGSEVLLWVLYATYEGQGDTKTDEFQKYADDHWSVVDYASWINANFSRSIYIDPNVNLKPWERVHWNELNNTEAQIGGDQTIQPTGFTHQLAPHGDQQYFEMIGKYSQFGGGWDDAAGFLKTDILNGTVSPNFLKYSQMRGDANSLYDIATTVSYVILANHLFGALEAAWNASRINHKIQLQGHIQSRRIYGNLVEFVPTFHLKYEL
jgi:hypothetical protein